MTKLKNNRTLLIAFVVVMVIGLVAVYVPFLFAPPPLYREPAEQPQDADLQGIPPSPPTSTPTSTPHAATPESQGFSGLNEEDQSLKDLDSLLGQ